MAVNDNSLSRWVRTGVLTGISDMLFSSILVSVFYHSTVLRLWQGVASVLLGPDAMNGGTRTALIGLLMHYGVAFTWSGIFIFLVMRSAWVRGVLTSPGGVAKVAAVYGPCIWLVMSLAVIPLMVHRPPTLNIRWLIQLVGHFVFVGLPLVGSASRELRLAAR